MISQIQSIDIFSYKIYVYKRQSVVVGCGVYIEFEYNINHLFH